MTNPTNFRPLNYLDAQGRVIYDSVEDIAFRAEYTGSNMIYKGFARPGAATTDPVWQVSKLSYDGAGNLLSITWPENDLGAVSNDYLFVWDDRATYTYS